VEPSSDDLAELREQFPAWTIEAAWTTSSSGPDRRYLVAHKASMTVSAWTAGDLAAEMRRQDAP
jgi:hypothetical protein